VVAVLGDFSEPADDTQVQQLLGASVAEPQGPEEAYAAVKQVASSLNKAEQAVQQTSQQANDLMADELAHLRNVGQLTLNGRAAAKELEQKRYEGVKTERLNTEKQMKEEQQEVGKLRGLLRQAEQKHSLAQAAAEKQVKLARVKFMNERGHKHAARESKFKSSKESKFKADASRRETKALAANEAKESSYKADQLKEMQGQHQAQLKRVASRLSKAKSTFGIAKSMVEHLSNKLKNEREKDAYLSTAKEYSTAVKREERSKQTLDDTQAEQKKVQQKIDKEQGEFEAIQAKQKRAQKEARLRQKAAASARESKNCVKMCKMYQIATDSLPSATASRPIPKEVCFPDKKTAKASGDNGKELGEGADCAGMTCKCMTYDSYQGIDDQDQVVHGQ
jgi:hypothetical protein